MKPLCLATLVLCVPACLAAQKADTTTQPIQDNSFLVEEAYNQDPGIVQHISQMSLNTFGRWAYTFTQEWPVGGLSNQLSYTVPLLYGTGRYEGMKFGDLAINYRYQLVGGGDTRVAIAPRLTVMFPTGNEGKGTGAGATTFQANVPLSFVASPSIVLHSNVGYTHTRSSGLTNVSSNTSASDGTSTWNVGQSLIWIARPLFNVMLEGVATRTSANGASTNVAILSPGIRWGYNFQSGLQIVPGVAMPFTFTQGARTTRGAILYLSFEHPFMHVKGKS